MLAETQPATSTPKPLSRRRTPLTAEQGQRAEENVGLIGYCLTLLRRRFRQLQGADLDDVAGVGHLALLRAARDWEPARARFSTYAVPIMCRDMWTEAVRILGERGRNKSLAGQPRDREDRRDLPEPLDYREPDPADTVATRDAVAAALDALADLPPRKRELLTRYFGLDGGDQLTQQQLAGVAGVTRASVGGMIERALAELRTVLAGDADGPEGHRP